MLTAPSLGGFCFKAFQVTTNGLNMGTQSMLVAVLASAALFPLLLYVSRRLRMRRGERRSRSFSNVMALALDICEVTRKEQNLEVFLLSQGPAIVRDFLIFLSMVELHWERQFGFFGPGRHVNRKALRRALIRTKLAGLRQVDEGGLRHVLKSYEQGFMLEELRVIPTGGLSPALVPGISRRPYYVRVLMLQGIAYSLGSLGPRLSDPGSYPAQAGLFESLIPWGGEVLHLISEEVAALPESLQISPLAGEGARSGFSKKTQNRKKAGVILPFKPPST